jgi:hypothetical protein
LDFERAASNFESQADTAADSAALTLFSPIKNKSVMHFLGLGNGIMSNDGLQEDLTGPGHQ